MTVYRNLDDFPASDCPTAVTVGNFDGVHLGHQAIVATLLAEAKRCQLTSVALLFHPHPSVVLGSVPPPLLTTPEQRTELLISLGVEHCVIEPFTAALAQLSASDFLQQFLRKKLQMKVLSIGPNTHIGKDREGTPQTLRTFAKELGFELRIVEAVEKNYDMISSSRLRSLVADGDVESVRQLLGRPHRTESLVMRGDGRGKKLGFPTANLAPVETLLPKNGVYVTGTTLDGRAYPSVTNVGLRPTVSEATEQPLVETHLLDFQGELNEKSIRVEWMARLRKEQKFPSLEALSQQIQKDRDQARAFWKGVRLPGRPTG